MPWLQWAVLLRAHFEVWEMYLTWEVSSGQGWILITLMFQQCYCQFCHHQAWGIDCIMEHNFYFFVVLCEAGSFFVVLDVFQLSVWTRLILNTQWTTCVSLVLGWKAFKSIIPSLKGILQLSLWNRVFPITSVQLILLISQINIWKLSK